MFELDRRPRGEPSAPADRARWRGADYDWRPRLQIANPPLESLVVRASSLQVDPHRARGADREPVVPPALVRDHRRTINPGPRKGEAWRLDARCRPGAGSKAPRR